MRAAYPDQPLDHVATGGKSVGAIQPDVKLRKAMRPDYAPNADSLTMAAHVVAIEFATIAAANDYWRDKG